MKKADFILWLRGYFSAIDKTKPIEEIINELFEKIEQLDINITEKVIERIIEKEYPIYPNVPYPQFPIVTMYGCVTPGTAPVNNPYNTKFTTTNDDTK